MPQSRRTFLSSLLGTAIAVPAVGLNAATSPRTGYFSDSRLQAFDLATPETPQRIAAIEQRLADDGLLARIHRVRPLDDPMSAILSTHTASHVDAILRLGSPGTSAVLACAGVLGAVSEVLSGTIVNAFCAVRPPGHHAANLGRMWGYCYINHAAVAARFARSSPVRERVLIVDWDYHFGDGTHELVCGDQSIHFFSVHNRHAFPGAPRRPCNNATLVHLGAGSSDDDYIAAFEKQLLPVFDSFSPSIVIISAGFDGRKNDPIGRHSVTDEGYAEITRIVCAAAQRHCRGRIVSILEGGYEPEGLASAASAHVKALMQCAAG